VGFLKGLQLGQELGFIRSCLRVWKAQHSAQLLEVNERTLKGMARLDELVDRFVFDAKRETIAEELDNIRSKFKLVVSQLGLKEVTLDRVLRSDEQRPPQTSLQPPLTF